VSAEAPVARGTERIVIVDDEPAITKMLQQILTRLGYIAEPQISSTEALALFQSRPHDFDLLITDMTMPDMTGDILVRKIRDIRPDLPVILCTGYSSRISGEKAQAMGIQALARKPFDRNELAITVRKVLDASKP
jgi:CheY-like chemotaxis protein